MPDFIASPSHDLDRFEGRLASWRPSHASTAPVDAQLGTASVARSPAAALRAWQCRMKSRLKSRMMSFLDRRLPLWRSIKAQQRQLDALAAQSAQQTTRIATLLREQAVLRRRLGAGDGERKMAGWYQALQDDYRSHDSQVEARFQGYLALLDAIADDLLARAPVLDLGCGAGDWLCALRDHGIAARGVDSNKAAVTRARAQRCDVDQGDLLDCLGELPTGSVAAVTSLQVVEHLPWADVFQFFSEAFRVIGPGGLLLVETPNPENLQVAGYGFWLDPTHQRPIPPPLLLHLAKFLGFVDCHILRSAPWPQWEAPQASPEDEGPPAAGPDQDAPTPGRQQPAGAEALNTLLYGPQDYALVARRPGA